MIEWPVVLESREGELQQIRAGKGMVARFDVKDYITGFGSPQWKKTHEAAEKTAVVITTLLKHGATCVGNTIMDELGFGVIGENKHYGTPINPLMPSNVPGGCSSGSAVSVGAELVDFSLRIDTTGGVRIPASFCGMSSKQIMKNGRKRANRF
ncbi:PREDICTED: outer envelope protein 64, mitochondrial-like [Camelina sativa]|uniref:Outer envelope protein 64, mitochondrial-like n=1 Tax=Camelina sativa TaxID=90675 RepID=A0ABM0WBC5_CAMSA|nr:PREDICTED: outer envelope protein 64, mitochondrial-like [Camelina sativa]